MLIGTVVPNNYMMPWESVKSFLKVRDKYRVIYHEGPLISQNRDHLRIIAKLEKESLCRKKLIMI